VHDNRFCLLSIACSPKIAVAKYWLMGNTDSPLTTERKVEMPRIGLANVSVAQLQAELQRRLSELPKLEAQRAAAARLLAALDHAIALLKGAAVEFAPAKLVRKYRRRKAKAAKVVAKPAVKANGKPAAKAKLTIADALVVGLKGKASVSVDEAVAAAQAAGYVTKGSAVSFRTQINQKLSSDARFERLGRGKYRLKAE
jgi:hypothetical protein